MFHYGFSYTSLAEEDLQQVASGAVSHEVQLVHHERSEQLLEMASKLNRTLRIPFQCQEALSKQLIDITKLAPTFFNHVVDQGVGLLQSTDRDVEGILDIGSAAPEKGLDQRTCT